MILENPTDKNIKVIYKSPNTLEVGPFGTVEVTAEEGKFWLSIHPFMKIGVAKKEDIKSEEVKEGEDEVLDVKEGEKTFDIETADYFQLKELAKEMGISSAGIKKDDLRNLIKESIVE